MESNITLEQMKAIADADGNVTIRIAYPKGWAKPMYIKDGEIRTMHYDLAAHLINRGIASVDLEAKDEAPAPVQTEQPAQVKKPATAKTTSSNKKTTTKSNEKSV